VGQVIWGGGGKFLEMEKGVVSGYKIAKTEDKKKRLASVEHSQLEWTSSPRRVPQLCPERKHNTKGRTCTSRKLSSGGSDSESKEGLMESVCFCLTTDFMLGTLQLA
jgi:hypothetical protein